MKKMLLAVACILVATGCTQKGQGTTTDTKVQAEDTLLQEYDLLDMEQIYQQLSIRYDGDVQPFTRYARLQLFGFPAVLFAQDNGPSEALFVNLPEEPYTLAADHQGPGHIEIFEHGLKSTESCGTGCSMTEYIEYSANHLSSLLSTYTETGPDGKVTAFRVELMGYDDTLSEQEGRQAVADADDTLGKALSIDLQWQPLKP